MVKYKRRGHYEISTPVIRCRLVSRAVSAGGSGGAGNHKRRRGMYLISAIGSIEISGTKRNRSSPGSSNPAKEGIFTGVSWKRQDIGLPL